MRRSVVIAICVATACGSRRPSNEPIPIAVPDTTPAAVDGTRARDSTAARPRAYVIPFVIRDTLRDSGDQGAHDDEPLRTRRSITDTLPVSAVPETLAFAALAARELAAFDPHVTLAVWQQQNPADSLQRFVGGSGDAWKWWEPFAGPLCARAKRRIPLEDGRVALREAVFHPPTREAGEDLPHVRDTLGLDLVACRLGAMWLYVPAGTGSLPHVAPDPADSARMIEQIREVRSALRDRIGAEDWIDGSFLNSGFRLADGLEIAYWLRGDLAYAVLDSWGRSSALSLETEVVAGAWTLASGLDLTPLGPGVVPAATETAELVTIVEQVGLDGVLADSLLRTAHRKHWSTRGFPEIAVADSVFYALLVAWLDGIDERALSVRAAALLVADQVLATGLGSVDSTEKDRTRPFEQLGAEYHKTLGATYYYARNWAQETLALEDAGSVHDRAFLLLLRRGFRKYGCSHEPENFRAVIERGERFLADQSDSSVGPEVELEIARAYGDVVALADEIDSTAASYVDGADYRDEAPSARRFALRHYRSALEGLADPKLSADAWREAWRLAAGMPPVGTHYVSICD